LYEYYREAGLPSLPQLMSALRASAGDLLVEYQMQVADFWQIYERVPRSKSKLVLGEIEKCQRLISAELEKIKHEGITGKNKHRIGAARDGGSA
jgi:hypothetical protein